MAYSRAMDVKGRKMVEGDFAVQARLSQHLKDVRLMLDAAADAGAGAAALGDPSPADGARPRPRAGATSTTARSSSVYRSSRP